MEGERHKITDVTENLGLCLIIRLASYQLNIRISYNLSS
jgi:hypothetical protein